jgi:hypothetical protein
MSCSNQVYNNTALGLRDSRNPSTRYFPKSFVSSTINNHCRSSNRCHMIDLAGFSKALSSPPTKKMGRSPTYHSTYLTSGVRGGRALQNEFFRPVRISSARVPTAFSVFTTRNTKEGHTINNMLSQPPTRRSMRDLIPAVTVNM